MSTIVRYQCRIETLDYPLRIFSDEFYPIYREIPTLSEGRMSIRTTCSNGRIFDLRAGIIASWRYPKWNGLRRT